MKKLLILLTTAIVAFSCMTFASVASARTEVSAVVLERGHHHYRPYWHRPHHRHHHWRPRHRYYK